MILIVMIMILLPVTSISVVARKLVHVAVVPEIGHLYIVPGRAPLSRYMTLLLSIVIRL